MAQIAVVGLDLAKNIFQVHCADDFGKKLISKKLSRVEVLPFLKRLSPCTVAMEACSGSTFWAREIARLGHFVKVLPANYVKPFVKRGKTDAIDAEAICVASLQESMPVVPIKTLEQQAVVMLIKSRAFIIRERLRIVSALRGHLTEVGIVFAKGAAQVGHLIKTVRGRSGDEVLSCLGPALAVLCDQIELSNRHIKKLDKAIAKRSKRDEDIARLMTIPGIGPLTAATLKAYVPDPSRFKSARHFAAWIGLTPRSHSTGGTRKMRGITKMGNSQLRTLLVMGAFAVLREARRKPAKSVWFRKLLDNRPFKVAAVAVANKSARIAWALMSNGSSFDNSQL